MQEPLQFPHTMLQLDVHPLQASLHMVVHSPLQIEPQPIEQAATQTPTQESSHPNSHPADSF